jgi:hypothetical protein
MRPSSAAFLAAVCFLCLSASRCSSPASPSDGRRVSIMAYNVKMLLYFSSTSYILLLG